MLVLNIKKYNKSHDFGKCGSKDIIHTEIIELNTKSVVKAKKIADEMIDEDDERIKEISIQKIEDGKITNLWKKSHYVIKFLFGRWESKNI